LRARAKCGAYPALHSRSQLGLVIGAEWPAGRRIEGLWEVSPGKSRGQFDCQITGRHQGHKQRKAHKTCAIQPWSCELKNPSRLILLRQTYHLFFRFDRGWEQHGHRSSRAARRTAISRRRVAIEFGTWRSVRIGGAPGSVIFGKGRHFDDSAAPRL
jgi:hypothetical protein